MPRTYHTFTHEEPAERIVCHPRDYDAAGLWRNGPVTRLAVRSRPNFTFDPALAMEPRRVVYLEPDPGCPPGEVRVAS